MQRGGADGSVYSSAQGLPTALTATFDGFYRNPDLSPADHTPANSDNKMIAGETNDPATITFFNLVAEVPSMWIENQLNLAPIGESTRITGSLGGVEQFAVEWAWDELENGFFEVTAGAGKTIDTITFTNFADTELDDVTINAVVPEPTGLLGAVAAVPVLRRARRLARRESGSA